MKEKIQSIIDEKIKNSRVYDLLEKNDILYIMIDIQTPVEQKLSISLEKLISDQLQVKTKLCLTQIKSQQTKQIKVKRKIPGVKKVIMICSGKGGVGKSTISSYLAYCLSLTRHKVGLFDSDIYGPSIGKIFNIEDEIKIQDGRFIPHEKFGVKLMSIGFIVKSDDALVWRGPMVTKTLSQMLLQTNWKELDYLIIDTPPGTGDVHLSLAENYEIDGAIVVSTPQSLALANAHRSVDMLEKLKINLLGIVENMAYIINQDSSKNFIFGEGNIENYSADKRLKLLAQIPIIQEISQSSFTKNKKHLSKFISLANFLY